MNEHERMSYNSTLTAAATATTSCRQILKSVYRNWKGGVPILDLDVPIFFLAIFFDKIFEIGKSNTKIESKKTI